MMTDQLCTQCQGPTQLADALSACTNRACRNVQLTWAAMDVQITECIVCKAPARMLCWCEDCEVYMLEKPR